MASISGYDSNSMSTLLSSLNAGATSSFNQPNVLGINLSDYNTIRSGSYFKLMKSYYSKVEKEDGSTATSADQTKTLAKVESAADDLSESAKKLYSSSSDVFKKTSKKDENGKTVSEYDVDAIYQAVNSFVEDYNALVKGAGKAEASNIANAGAALVNNTNQNASLLQKIGIKVDSDDYSMSIDEKKFKESDMEAVKSLFHGNGSYGYSTAVKASMLKSYAQLESTKSNTYGKNGSYSYNFNTGKIYNTET